MAVTECPSCNKKISDKASTCSHCGFAIGDASSEELLRKQSLNRFKKQHSVQNQSMFAMLLFVGGFGFMYWGGAMPGDLQHTLAVAVAVTGFVWYVVNRIRLIFLKRAD